MSYPELWDDGIATRFGCFELDAFSRDERIYLNEKAYDIARVIARQASAEGVFFADVIDEFKGHRVCDGGINNASEWLTGIEVSKKVAGDASFHPNAQGAEAYARVLTTFLEARAAEGGETTAAGLPRNPAPTSTFGRAHLRVASDDLTEQEIAEVAAMEFGAVEIEGLAFRRGEDSCQQRAALGSR